MTGIFSLQKTSSFLGSFLQSQVAHAATFPSELAPAADFLFELLEPVTGTRMCCNEQYSTEDSRTVESSIVQISTVQNRTVQNCALQDSVIQYCVVQYRAVQYSVIQYTVKSHSVTVTLIVFSSVQRRAYEQHEECGVASA